MHPLVIDQDDDVPLTDDGDAIIRYVETRCLLKDVEGILRSEAKLLSIEDQTVSLSGDNRSLSRDGNCLELDTLLTEANRREGQLTLTRGDGNSLSIGFIPKTLDL